MTARFSHLLPPHFKAEIRQWIRDDCPSFDVGGYVVGDKIEIAHLLCKGSCVLAGVPFVNAVFEELQLEISWFFDEGQFLSLSKDEDGKAGKLTVAVVKGSCRNILLAERTALNILSRACGIASAARRASEIKESCGWHGFVAGTRKTTPGFKTVEKYALIVGGATTHRLDLSQMVMLKDNHIWSSGSISNAVTKARDAAGFSIKIEVECQSLEEGLEAAGAGADIVMLDNFDSDNIHMVARAIKEEFPYVLIEASGGITEETMPSFMSPNIDIISRGSLTQGYSCVDFSLKIHTEK